MLPQMRLSRAALLAAFTSLFLFAPLPLDCLVTRGGPLRPNSNTAGGPSRNGAGGVFYYDVWENASAGHVVANLTRDVLLSHETLAPHRALFDSAPSASAAAESARLSLLFVSLFDNRLARWFRVDETGVVSVVLTPDREEPILCANQQVECVQSLRVIASVEGCQHSSSGDLPALCRLLGDLPTFQITLNLWIRDVNDHQPAFPSDQLASNNELLVLDVSEADPVGTRKALPLAIDRDLGNNSLVRYNKSGELHVFADPNMAPVSAPARGEYFSLEASPSSGAGAVQRLELVLRRPLDCELIDSVFIDVTATDAGSPALSTVCRFRVQVHDANDNAPHFRNSSYVVSVPESERPDDLPYRSVPFLRVEATDADRSSPNNEVRYALAPGSQSLADLVSVYPVEGELYLQHGLDYETMPELSFQVVAYDQSAQSRHTATATVLIKVLDRNDHQPEIMTPNCKRDAVALRENAPEGTPLPCLFYVQDQDTGRNGEVSCALSAGAETFYRLVEAGSDSSSSSSSGASSSATGGAQQQQGASASRMRAFRVLTRVALDREARENPAQTQFAIECHDNPADAGAQRATHFPIRVELDDLNDCVPLLVEAISRAPHAALLQQPQQQQGLLRVEVLEGNTAGEVVFTLRAFDCDAGQNAEVRFAIANQSSPGLFTVDAATGEVRANTPLDREARANYWLNVSVHDMGTPALSSSASLAVLVADTNDNAPVIECARSCRREQSGSGGESRLVFETSVREDAPPGAQVLKLVARDADAGANAALHYELVEIASPASQSPSQVQNINAVGDPHPRFRIDQTGLVTVGARLDAEKRALHTLHVLVSDAPGGGERRHTSSATLVVSVEDVNENPPHWVHMVREVVIDSPDEMPVFTAKDDDASDTHLTYSLQSSRANWERVFEIDRNTGRLLVLWHALRREDLVGRWPLRVEVSDAGSPPRHSLMDVLVAITEEAAAKASGAQQHEMGAVNEASGGRAAGYWPESSPSASGAGDSRRGQAASGGRSGGGVADNLILMLCLIAVMVLMIVLCGVAIYILWRGRLNLARGAQQRATTKKRKRHDTVSSSPLPAAVSNDLNLIPPQYPLSPPKRSATLTSSSKMRRMDLEESIPMVGLGLGVGTGPAADGGEPGYRAYSSEGSLSGELCTSAVVAGNNNNGSLGVDSQDACAVAGPGLQTFQMQLQGCPVDLEVEDESCACGHLPTSPLPPRPHQHRPHQHQHVPAQRAHKAGAEEATGDGDGDGEADGGALAHPDEEASAYRGGSQRPPKSEYTSTAYADPSRLSHAHEASTHAASPQRELFDPRQKAEWWLNRYVGTGAETAGRPTSRALQTPASLMADAGACVGPMFPSDPRSYRTLGPGAFAVPSAAGPLRPFPLMSPIPLQMQMQMGMPLPFAFPTSPGPGPMPIPTTFGAGAFPQFVFQQSTPAQRFQPTPSLQLQQHQAPSNGIVYMPQSQQRGRQPAATDSSLV